MSERAPAQRMTDIKRVGDAGIHTVEGNLAGSKAARLTKQREQQRADYEALKNKIKQENSTDVAKIASKFSTASNAMDQEFQRKTVGLISAEDFRKAREEIAATKSNNLQLEKDLKQVEEEIKKTERELKRKKINSSLSFGMDDDEEPVEVEFKIKKRKNPTVDTSFLPDRDRDREVQQQVEQLKAEWLEQQEVIKNEMLEVTYSYWDGSGHRKTLKIKKGATIGKFLEAVKQQLVGEFSELRSTSAEDLIYVKEDLIIPQHLSFYDLIITKARGKSGPLFHFDVHDDIRLIADARVEKDESHPGKVVDRRWFERNKHIFPASRWELYDPSVARDAGYTIHGQEVTKKN